MRKIVETRSSLSNTIKDTSTIMRNPSLHNSDIGVTHDCASILDSIAKGTSCFHYFSHGTSLHRHSFSRMIFTLVIIMETRSSLSNNYHIIIMETRSSLSNTIMSFFAWSIPTSPFIQLNDFYTCIIYMYLVYRDGTFMYMYNVHVYLLCV